MEIKGVTNSVKGRHQDLVSYYLWSQSRVWDPPPRFDLHSKEKYWLLRLRSNDMKILFIKINSSHDDCKTLYKIVCKIVYSATGNDSSFIK